ncbi:ATP-binding protein [Vibrio parahaemolyticus]|uniref:ATP-binding protein n=3 Tax=Vibrio parahaemolyticus TaxID=670 RepID=UPI000421A8D1|nr:ATP-binding protein [Vibrio parahaemolyticus]ELB2962443.1 AAA family ATPase [Vibrio parahaemolyticus]KON51920.1 hypothetical protein ACX02_21035 [Vibrio parahaemolyticus]MDG3434176.1 ATP-binding protein [Vibrio parahaemolyticus]HAS6731702.1 AAA family ATPase [Vibrio parahaemolyticus]
MSTDNKLYCMDEKIEKLCKTCRLFLDSDQQERSKLSQLSVYPTFLFDGYPGTGKSSVANIIYGSLKKDYNIDIYRLNIDELISSDFGESSHNLREYFSRAKREIEENKSICFVILDEVDSFTISRYRGDNDSIKRILLTFNTIIDDLVRSGDIYNFILVATTNVKEVVDTSVLRRFSFKEDFNIEVDEDTFYQLLEQLSVLTDLKVDKSTISDMFQIYTRKKYTLGEVKAIFAKQYVEALVSAGEPVLNPQHFQEYQTFHEITVMQK